MGLFLHLHNIFCIFAHTLRRNYCRFSQEFT